MRKNFEVSVIVPVFNQSAQLMHCLKCIADQDFSEPYEVIVVDNGSTEDLSTVKAAFPQFKWLLETKAGSYNARNAGILASSANLLAFTDADCAPARTWMAFGVTALREHPGASFVGGAINMVTRATGQLTIAEVYDWASGFPQRRFVNEVHFAMTANMLTRRSAFEAVGFFDGRLKSGGDREWGNRAWNGISAGHFAPGAIVSHPARGTTAEVMLRVRRVAGGARDRHPEWSHCMFFFARNLVPPRRAILDIWALPSANVSNRAKFFASLFAYRVRLVFAWERLRLQLTGEESERR